MFFATYFLEYNRYLNLIGIFAILGCAYVFSRNKKAVNGTLVLRGMALHVLIAFFMLKTTVGAQGIGIIADGVSALYHAADAGSQFLFGNLSMPAGPWGFVFALKVLPIIIFFGAFMALLFHWGIVQFVVRGLSCCVQPILKTSGAETLCAIANSFLGQTEAPLLIRHYLAKLTPSEMLVVMVSGMGTISGSILAVYAAMGVPVEHLLAASVMAIPATLVIAKILLPETGKVSDPADATPDHLPEERKNIFDVLASGTSDGLHLALNVAAMLVAFIALLALLNTVLAVVVLAINHFFMMQLPVISLQSIFGLILAPFGYLLGLTGNEIYLAGELLGIKVAVNEMVAYSTMLTMDLSPRAVALITYALCGFSNFSCIGIQLGGIGALAPAQRSTLSRLGLYAVLGGTLSNLLSAMMAGLML